MKIILRTFILFSALIPSLLSAQWNQRVKISTGAVKAGLNENMGPCLAVSNDTIHVVWSDHRTKGWSIYYKHSLDTGKTWSTSMPITDTTGKASMPVIAVSGKNVHVVWMDSLAGIRCSYYIRSTDGGNTWGQKALIDPNTLFWPSIAANGNLVIIGLNKGTFGVNTEVWITRSTDNGNTWAAEQQISNANGRSEDQAITIEGSQVHMSWNDNRTGTMYIEYRHSYDGGVTWGPETAVTNTNSYTTMTSANGIYTDVVYGINNLGNFDVGLVQSSDSGITFSAPKILANTAVGEAYPYMTRDKMNLHVVYGQFGSPGSVMYTHSTDGGATWVSPIKLDYGFQTFIAYTKCALHVIYQDSSVIYYRRNPTGNGVCNPATGMAEQYENASAILYPNPFTEQSILKISSAEKIENAELKIFDLVGNVVRVISGINMHEIKINRNNLLPGIYFYQLKNNGTLITQGKLIAQ